MHKAIPETRDKLQSRLLVLTVGSLLACFCLPCLVLMVHPFNAAYACRQAVEVSLTFGLGVWALKAATPMAAFFGSMICLQITIGTEYSQHSALLHSGLVPLASLFVLTFLATRIGKKRRPELTSSREVRHGRNSAQVIANLGCGPLTVICGSFGWYDWTSHGVSGLYGASVFVMRIMLLATLVEATADTVSSELGQAFGGTPYLLSTLKPAAPGTDGAISLLGTSAGILAGALVAASGARAMRLNTHWTLAALAGGIAGLFFDSLLGATVERRGWLGNDLVNFSSTAFAAVVALALCAL